MIYKKSKLNFIAKDQRDHPIYNKRNLVGAGISLVIFVFAAINLNIYFKLQEKREALRTMASLNADLNQKIQSLSHTSVQNLNDRDAAIRHALDEKIYWADAFKELSMIVPNDVWLTDFETAMLDGKRVMSITGQSASNKKMTDFFSSLERSFFFRDVQIRFSEKLAQFTPDLFRFKFECNVAEQKAAQK